MILSILWIVVVALGLIALCYVACDWVQDALEANRKARRREEYLTSWFKGVDLNVLREYSPDTFRVFFLKFSGQLAQIDGLGKFITYLESRDILTEDRPKAWFVTVLPIGARSGKQGKHGIGFANKNECWWSIYDTGVPDSGIVIEDIVGGQLRFDKHHADVAAQILDVVTKHKTKDAFVLCNLHDHVKADEDDPAYLKLLIRSAAENASEDQPHILMSRIIKNNVAE